MHFLTSGLCAAMFFVVLVRLGVLTEPATVRHPTLSATVMTTALGLSMGVIWELFEWFGHTFMDDEMLVGYEDSLGDLVAGGPGSLLSGLGVRYLMARPCAASRPRMEA